MKVIYRKEWGARAPKNRTLLSPSAITDLVIHYSGSNADQEPLHKNCAARVRGIQRFHMDSRGWSDIAYNWLVCRHGYIFRGRGWAVMSAATLGHNDHTVAVCFLGGDAKGKADVPEAAKDAIREIYKFCKERTPRDIDAKGHRDFVPTSCPGDELYAFLKTLKPED